MRKYALVVIGLLFLAGCGDGGKGVPAATPPLLKATETAVPPTIPSPPIVPTATSTANLAKIPQPTPSLPPFTRENEYNVFTQDTYGFSLQYPPGWTPITTLPDRISLAHAGDSITLRLAIRRVTDDVDMMRTGVAAGSFSPRQSVCFLGQSIASDALVYQNKDKAVFYERASEIRRGDLVFIITLESNTLNYESIAIPQDVQREANGIVASVELTDPLIYTNPVMGIELTVNSSRCITEPDYLFEQYGFTLSDPNDWGQNLLSVDWLYQTGPEQMESVVRQITDNYPEWDVQQASITIDGHEGVSLWPLPGTETTTHIYLTANGRLYQLILWGAPLDGQAQALLDGLHFIEPTQSLNSLNLPPAR